MAEKQEGELVKIMDVLLLGPEELKILRDKYISCKINNLTSSEDLIQQYRLSMQVEDEEDYYNFLLDNCMAMSSHNFYSRVKVDKSFADRMKKRI